MEFEEWIVHTVFWLNSYLGLFQGQNYNLMWICPWVEQASQGTAHTPPESRRKTGWKKQQCLPEPWQFKADRYHLLQAY